MNGSENRPNRQTDEKTKKKTKTSHRAVLCEFWWALFFKQTAPNQFEFYVCTVFAWRRSGTAFSQRCECKLYKNLCDTSCDTMKICFKLNADDAERNGNYIYIWSEQKIVFVYLIFCDMPCVHSLHSAQCTVHCERENFLSFSLSLSHSRYAIYHESSMIAAAIILVATRGKRIFESRLFYIENAQRLMSTWARLFN